MFMEHPSLAILIPVALTLNNSRSKPAIPLELRQIRKTLPCGVEVLTVAIQATHRDFTYALVAMPGFEGGGRDADGACCPRSVSEAYTPKQFNSESQKMEAVWPPLAPTVRLINGREFQGYQFPETPLTRRMERAWCKVEPLMRQLCNLMQAKLVNGQRKSDPVSYTVLIERIKADLADL